jgi:hypothetical protein
VSLEKPLDCANPQVLVDIQWVDDHLVFPYISASYADYHFKVIGKFDYQRYFKKKDITV